MSTPGEPETVRIERLLDAQSKAAALFDEIERRGMVRPGVGERQLSDEIRDLAADLFGVKRHWHKRVVRAGENTLLPFHADPPDRVMADADIAYLDLGPIFEEWEADFGRTYVLGDDPEMLALRDALPGIWQAGRAYFEVHPDITGAQLYEHVVDLARERGFEFGAPIAGHLLGEFPHKKISGDDTRFYITPGSDEPMRRTDPTGRVCHWILEVHLTNRARGFGGFYEQLLDVG